MVIFCASPTTAIPEPQLAPDYRPPDTGDLCPAIEENYELCSDDTWSGNCPGFVTDAGRLGEIYRSELREHPGWGDALRTTIWWGCGSAKLEDLQSLLLRLDSPQARSVLAEEPYQSLGPPRVPARAAPPPNRELDCVAPSTEPERGACAAHNLSQAKAAHARAYANCSQKVAPALSGELVDAEESWVKLLPLECEGDAYTRDDCLARAYQERTQSIASQHPECAGHDQD